MSRVIPALDQYTARLPRGVVDRGYYTNTDKDRVLSMRWPGNWG